MRVVVDLGGHSQRGSPPLASPRRIAVGNGSLCEFEAVSSNFVTLL